jgi:ankyrin repeat protein
MNAGIEELELLTAFEVHSVDRIRAVLDQGIDVRSRIKGKTLVNTLIEMYLRSDRFPDCLRLLLERGAVLDDPKIAPVLLNDPKALAAAARSDPDLLRHKTTMVSAFTPLSGASLLHIAAEYGHLQVARKLLELGADVDSRAATNVYGFGGHTPLFHTVNSNANRSAPVMRLLLEAGAKVDLFLRGITWGKGFDWETQCFDVTPISYAQLGLLRQFQRSEDDTYANIRTLLLALGREVPPLDNVPNGYLRAR